MCHDAAGPLQECSRRLDCEKGWRDLAGNNKLLVSPLEPNLKTPTKFLWKRATKTSWGHEGTKTDQD